MKWATATFKMNAHCPLARQGPSIYDTGVFKGLEEPIIWVLGGARDLQPHTHFNCCLLAATNRVRQKIRCAQQNVLMTAPDADVSGGWLAMLVELCWSAAKELNSRHHIPKLLLFSATPHYGDLDSFTATQVLLELCLPCHVNAPHVSASLRTFLQTNHQNMAAFINLGVH